VSELAARSGCEDDASQTCMGSAQVPCCFASALDPATIGAGY